MSIQFLLCDLSLKIIVDDLASEVVFGAQKKRVEREWGGRVSARLVDIVIWCIYFSWRLILLNVFFFMYVKKNHVQFSYLTLCVLHRFHGSINNFGYKVFHFEKKTAFYISSIRSAIMRRKREKLIKNRLDECQFRFLRKWWGNWSFSFSEN